jgi:hypothetical protein
MVGSLSVEPLLSCTVHPGGGCVFFVIIMKFSPLTGGGTAFFVQPVMDSAARSIVKLKLI